MCIRCSTIWKCEKVCWYIRYWILCIAGEIEIFGLPWRNRHFIASKRTITIFFIVLSWNYGKEYSGFLGVEFYS